MMYKILGKPLGIWLAWFVLVYATAIALMKIAALLVILPQWHLVPGLPDYLVSWPVLVMAILSLARRRFIACTFSGMAYVILVYECIGRYDLFGIALTIVGFLGLYFCRRWFDEKIPRTW